MPPAFQLSTYCIDYSIYACYFYDDISLTLSARKYWLFLKGSNDYIERFLNYNMTYVRKHKSQTIRKSPGAQQFQEGLLDEVRFDYEMNSLWIKYRFDIILPVNDYSKVIFNGNENNPEFKKLKDFISNFEETWSFEEDSNNSEEDSNNSAQII